MVTVMKFDKDEVEKFYIFICTTGPPLGLIFGGIFVQKVYGGYEYKNSIIFVVIQMVLSTSFIIPVYFLNSIWSISICLWFLLFFGASTIPTLQGIAISSLKFNLRASGNSLTNLLINTLGFSAAPFFYGWIFELTKEKDPKLSFALTLMWGFVALIFSIVCLIFRFKKFKDPNSQENKNIEIIYQMNESQKKEDEVKVNFK